MPLGGYRGAGTQIQTECTALIA